MTNAVALCNFVFCLIDNSSTAHALCVPFNYRKVLHKRPVRVADSVQWTVDFSLTSIAYVNCDVIT